MNYVNGGPNGKRLVQLTGGNGTSNILIVWDHGKTPGCADSSHAATATNPRGPWPFPDTTNPKTHYPDQRHTNVFNVLYCDGHVVGMTATEMTQVGTVQFLAYGSTVTFPGAGAGVLCAVAEAILVGQIGRLRGCFLSQHACDRVAHLVGPVGIVGQHDAHVLLEAVFQPYAPTVIDVQMDAE